MATLVSLLVLTATRPSPCDDTPPKRPTPFPIVAYVPDYRIDALAPSVGALATDLIFFSIEPTPAGAIDASHLDARALAKLHAIRDRHKTRLLVALGGWGRSKNFVPVATDPAKRAHFAEALAAFCREHAFDGADFDWEHPANRAEEDAYAALLSDVRRAFGPDGRLLTLTLAAWQDPGPKAYEAVDRVQVMAYDHPGPRHSTFESAQADVARLRSRGVPAAKLCLGLPFYGRDMKDPDRVLTYAELVRQYHPAPNSDEAGGVSFNNVATIRRKTRYARENGLNGVMVWEVGQDTRDASSLLRAIAEAATK